MDRASYGKLVIKLPFDNTGKLTNFAFDSTPFRADADMDLALLEMVERSNNIRRSGTIFFKGLTYKLVTSPDTGRVWLDRNLGATQVATSSTDAASYGDLYQWGRAADGHQIRTSGLSAILATTITPGANTFIKNSASPFDWTSADSSGSSRTSAWTNAGANDICPAGFSVPTEAELTADTISATTTDITNTATAFSSFLKIPEAGYRSRIHGARGTEGAYLWSRSANGTSGRDLNVASGDAYFFSTDRAYGVSVRCIKSL
jgi:uncharacterized protein (TIGR02145 family)